MQVINPPLRFKSDSFYADDAVKPQLTAEKLSTISPQKVCWRCITGVRRDIDQSGGPTFAMQHVILQAASNTISRHLRRRRYAPFSKMAASGVSVIMSASTHAENFLFGYLIQQAICFGQHVHVLAARTATMRFIFFTRLSHFVPHFIALSAASPYMQGSDTRFACARLNIFPLFPITVPCRGSVTGKSLPDYFAVCLTPR